MALRMKVLLLFGSATRGLNRLDPSFQPPMARRVLRFGLYVLRPANWPYPPEKDHKFRGDQTYSSISFFCCQTFSLFTIFVIIFCM